MAFAIARTLAIDQTPSMDSPMIDPRPSSTSTPGLPMNTRRCRRSVFFLALLALLASAGLATAVPQLIDYQGKLTDSAGTPIDGATSMVFRIWNHVSAGSVVWAETQALVIVESGLFHVNLGAGYPIEEGLFNTDGLYLSIQVGADAQMTPRIPFQSVPYALVAEYAETAIGAWFYNFPDHYLTHGSVGIGTATPTERLHVYLGSGAVKAKIESGNGDADLVIAATGANSPSVEFQRNGAYGAGIGFDSTRTNLFLYHNGSVIVKDGKLGIGTMTPTNSLEVNGTVKVTGQCQGTFPRPNYDSGWRFLAVDPGVMNGVLLLNHNLGGNVDNYVVDVISKDTGDLEQTGINNHGIGSVNVNGSDRGYYFKKLTTSSITLFRESEDTSSHELRVRIWVYN
jgi:hypothetical protein